MIFYRIKRKVIKLKIVQAPISLILLHVIMLVRPLCYKVTIVNILLNIILLPTWKLFFGF